MGAYVPRPSVKQLEYFLAVARCGSFRRAAEDLEISQPTITAQIARIETSLGVMLFERGRTGTILSPAGRRLLPIARKVLEDLDELVQAAGSGGGGGAVYRMGVKSTLGPYALPRILPAIHRIHSDLKLYVREESPLLLESQLERGELDLVLTAYPANSTELAGEPLLRESIRLVVPGDHPLASKPVVEGKDLRGQRILTTGEGHHFTRQIEQLCQVLGAEVQRDYQGTSLDALRLMVVMGMGLAFLPALYIHSEINAGSDLVVRDIEDETIARTLGLVWRATSPSRTFYRALAEDMREIMRQEYRGVIEVLERPG